MFGLSFLNSLFLWGLAAASLPIIIHLIRRNRAVKVPFAAMRFLESSPKKMLRRQKLRQLLLLLMRITALALLALAFARPFFQKAPAGGLIAETPKAVVLLLDNSLSMSASNRLARAAREARRILQDTHPGDFVAVVRFAETSQVLVDEAEDPRALASSVDSWLQSSYAGTRYLQALQTAENLLQRSMFPEKTVYLISDFEGSPKEIEGTSYRLAPGIRLEAVQVGGDPSLNAAVTAVRLPTEAETNDQLLAQIRVRPAAAGAQDRRIKVSLVINGKVVDRRQVDIKENGEGVVAFRQPRSTGRMLTGYVEIEAMDGSISADDRFYFVLRSRGKVRVLAINGEPQQNTSRDELFFVDRAFNLPGASPFELVSIYPNQIQNENLIDYQVILLANVKRLARKSVERLGYFVRTGGGLVITLGDQISPSYFNRAFAELSPATLTGTQFETLSRDRAVLLAQAEYYHPIFQAFADPGTGDLAAAHFYQYYKVTPVEGSEVLARFDDGGAALLERSVGEGKVVLFTSTIDNEWNDLPVRPLFLPFLYQVGRYLAPEEGQQASYVVGQPVMIAAAEGRLEQPQVRTPSGRVITVGENETFFTGTSEPGIYELSIGQEVRYFAVNIDPNEAIGQAFDPQSFVDRFVNRETEPARAAMTGGSQAVQKEMEKRQRLWRYLLIGVMVLLLGETVLANRTYR
jgi:hypothetical protein